MDEITNTQDSALVKDLRKQIADKNKAIKELELQLGSARNNARREIALETELEAFGVTHEKVRAMVLDELGDGEVSARSVEDALLAIGFHTGKVAAEDDGETQPPAPQVPAQPDNGLAEALSAVSTLSNQVANAAKNVAGSSLTDKINSANSAEEVASIMREAGLGM